MEVERKFLVSERPGDLGPGVKMEQAYLAVDDDVEVRIRRTESACSLTVKIGSGLARHEVETPLSSAAFDELWPLVPRRLRKVRHRVAVDGGIAEVDCYEGALGGLEVVEVEFDSESHAAAFEAPAWFGRELDR